MIKEFVAQRLQAAGLGENLFIHHAPENLKSSIVILDSLDGVRRDEDLPNWKKADFQVIVRRTDYQSAMTIAKQVLSALDLHRQSSDGLYVVRMRASYDPIAFPIPDSDVVEVSINMWTAFVEQ